MPREIPPWCKKLKCWCKNVSSALHDRTSTVIKLEQPSCNNLAKNSTDSLKNLFVVGTKFVETMDLVPFSGAWGEGIHRGSSHLVRVGHIHPPQDVGPLAAMFRILFCKTARLSPAMPLVGGRPRASSVSPTWRCLSTQMKTLLLPRKL